MSVEPLGEQMDAAEARERLARVKAAVVNAWDDLIALFAQRAWLALDYPSWEALCDAELDGARIALPRQDRREVVGRMREAGMSTRAIGQAVGVPKSTVSDDLRLSESGQSTESGDSPALGTDVPSAPSTVTSLDGRQRPATRNLDAQVREALQRHPDLDVKHAPPEAVVKVARALDAVPAEDYGHRVEQGRKYVQWQARRGSKAPKADPADPTSVGDRLIDAAGSALSALRDSDDVWAAAWDAAEPLQRGVWRSTLTDLRQVIDALLARATNDLRRVK